MATQRTRESFIAAVGDVHGRMHAMVGLLRAWEIESGAQLSAVLQVGDFEPTRHEDDLSTMAVPRKYRAVGDFPDFHQGRAVFPWPVYFIGGNHEPYGYLESLPAGGTVAPNCHYLGRAGAVELDGLRIVGLSGIHSERGWLARPQLEDIHRTRRKLYTYYTKDDVDRAMRYGRADVLLLHDWPRGAYDPSEDNGRQHRRRRNDAIGNAHARMLVDVLRPRLVLAGHMHWAHRSWLAPGIRFAALAHIDAGRDAFAVFRISADGALAEISPWPGAGPPPCARLPLASMEDASTR